MSREQLQIWSDAKVNEIFFFPATMFIHEHSWVLLQYDGAYQNCIYKIIGQFHLQIGTDKK